MTEQEKIMDTPEQLNRRLRWLVIATVVVYLALIGFIGAFSISFSNQRAELRRITLNTNAALCTLRSDLEVRLQGAKDFLAEHPDGIAGITAATLQQSITNQERTVTALSGLECP